MTKDKDFINLLQTNFNLNYLKELWLKIDLQQRQDLLSKYYKTKSIVIEKSLIDDFNKLNPNLKKYIKKLVIEELN